MKINRFLPLFSLLLVGSFLLTACTGSTVINTFPGVTATEKTVYLADQGSVYAIDVSNGTMTWRYPQKPDNSKPFYAPPALSDTLIVAGNYGHQLVGFDPSNTAAAKWTFDTGSGNQVAGNFVGGPLILGDTVLAPASNNRLYALALASGQVRWQFEAKNALWATPVSDGTTLYQAGLDHTLYALKVSDGSLVWKKDLGSALLAAPILTKDGTLYQSTMEGNVVAVKASDGSILWTAKTGSRVWSAPVLHDTNLYIGNDGGSVFAISTTDGKIAWQKAASSPVSPIAASGAILPDGVVFVTEAGNVVALSFDGQKELWKQTINGKLYTTPVVAGQTLVVAVTGGDKGILLQAYSLNGQASWSFVAPK